MERTHCRHPSDNMSSDRTPCPLPDPRLTPTCCATPAVCDLCAALRTLLPLVCILPAAKLYDIEEWPVASKRHDARRASLCPTQAHGGAPYPGSVHITVHAAAAEEEALWLQSTSSPLAPSVWR